MLLAVVDAVDEVADTEDDNVSAEGTSEEIYAKDASVEGDEAHNGASETGENPDEAVSGIIDIAEAEDDFENAANEGINGDDGELIDWVAIYCEEDGEGADGVEDGEENGDEPTVSVVDAVIGINELNDGEGKEEKTDEVADVEGVGAWVVEHNEAENKGEGAFDGED